MKKIIYVANIRLPTEKAHGIQIMKMCEAFADQGREVVLVIPNKKNYIKDDPFDYYKVRRNFEIQKLRGFYFFGHVFTHIAFGLSLFFHCLFQNETFYTRDKSYALVLRLMGKRVVWEAHMAEKTLLTRILAHFDVPLVVITKGLSDAYVHLDFPSENIYVAPDAVDIEQFAIKQTREDARTRLGFKREEKIVLYTGHLYSWKGTDTLAEAARSLPKDIQVYFVGGTDNDIFSFKKKYGEVENINILGRKPHHEMPLYMRAADVLVIPNSAKEDISRLYTSPMKLFEYMASGTPIIASDLPSLREILNESNSSFFIADDAQDLSCIIVGMLAGQEKSEKKSALASEEVKKYSWQRRAQSILDFVDTKSGIFR